MNKKINAFKELKQFEICTGIGCKNMCKYCPQDTIIEAYKCREKMMSLNTFKVCVDQIPKHIRIVFGGMSEPFLNKDCIKMVEYVHEKGYKIDIFTTGVGIKKKDIELFKRIPFHAFELHLPDNDGNTTIEPTEEYLDIVKGIRKNVPNMEYKMFGKPHFKIQKALGEEIEDLSRILHNRAGNNIHMKSQYCAGIIECRYAGKFLNNNVLLPNGDITLCDMDYGLKYVFGNLIETPYKELLDSEKFQKFIKILNTNNGEILCRHCAYVRRMNTQLDRIRARWDDSSTKMKIYKIYKKARKILK
ncbi:SPASM domain-containing protein [Candidatus Pacearchaeota archaeon]|nr:SPASM domain-containing protein [Candidatus Pacearchaeota archaeon]